MAVFSVIVSAMEITNLFLLRAQVPSMPGGNRFVLITTGNAAGQCFLKPATTRWNRLKRASAMNDLARARRVSGCISPAAATLGAAAAFLQSVAAGDLDLDGGMRAALLMAST